MDKSEKKIENEIKTTHSEALNYKAPGRVPLDLLILRITTIPTGKYEIII
jgi:hypothetical protein